MHGFHLEFRMDRFAMSVLNSPKGPLHGILRDSENREVWSRLHGTKSFRTSDSQDEDADNLEAHVPLTYNRDIGASHKGRTHEAARTRVTLLAIDRANGGLRISFEVRDVTFRLFLRVTNQSVADFDIALIDAAAILRARRGA
jgi:hypothetical protein